MISAVSWKEDSKTKTQILKKSLERVLFMTVSKEFEERLRQSNKDMDKRQAQLDGHFASQVWSEEELASWLKQLLKN